MNARPIQISAGEAKEAALSEASDQIVEATAKAIQKVCSRAKSGALPGNLISTLEDIKKTLSRYAALHDKKLKSFQAKSTPKKRHKVDVPLEVAVQLQLKMYHTVNATCQEFMVTPGEEVTADTTLEGDSKRYQLARGCVKSAAKLGAGICDYDFEVIGLVVSAMLQYLKLAKAFLHGSVAQIEAAGRVGSEASLGLPLDVVNIIDDGMVRATFGHPRARVRC